MGFNLAMLKMSPQLFASCYTESDSARTDHFAKLMLLLGRHFDVRNLQLKPFCLEKSSVIHDM